MLPDTASRLFGLSPFSSRGNYDLKNNIECGKWEQVTPWTSAPAAACSPLAFSLSQLEIAPLGAFLIVLTMVLRCRNIHSDRE